MSNSKVVQLTICHTCHTHIKTNESFTEWEGSIYCESCFELYQELVSPHRATKTITEE